MRFISAIFMLLIVTSCSFNHTYTNRESDVVKAKSFAGNFYQLLKNKDYNQAIALFTLKNTTEAERNEKLGSYFPEMDTKAGPIANIELVSSSSKVTEGDKNIGEYDLVYYVTRGNMSFKDTFKISSENEKFEIVYYNVLPR
jgi:hypothetical protein